MAVPTKWIAASKGGPYQESFEIYVYNTRYPHAHKSYGWWGTDKVLISQSGSSREGLNSRVWHKLMRVAEETANELNEGIV
jgi:hypothetical protein